VDVTIVRGGCHLASCPTGHDFIDDATTQVSVGRSTRPLERRGGAPLMTRVLSKRRVWRSGAAQEGKWAPVQSAAPARLPESAAARRCVYVVDLAPKGRSKPVNSRTLRRIAASPMVRRACVSPTNAAGWRD